MPSQHRKTSQIRLHVHEQRPPCNRAKTTVCVASEYFNRCDVRREMQKPDICSYLYVDDVVLFFFLFSRM